MKHSGFHSFRSICSIVGKMSNHQTLLSIKKCSSPTDDCFFSKKPTKREHTHVHTLNRKVYIQTGFIKKTKETQITLENQTRTKTLMFVLNGTNESLAHPHLSQKACFCWMNSSTISVTSISCHRIQRWHRVKFPHRKKTHPCIVFRQRDSMVFSWLNMYVYTNYVWNYRLISKYDDNIVQNVQPKTRQGPKDNLQKCKVWFKVASDRCVLRHKEASTTASPKTRNTSKFHGDEVILCDLNLLFPFCVCFGMGVQHSQLQIALALSLV